MDEYARQHDPDQIVPSEIDPADPPQAHEEREAERPGAEPMDVEFRRPVPPAETAPPSAPPPRQAFWGSLTEIERAEFLASAEQVFYPVGTVLWFEGQTADRAVVIRSGSIRVSVERDGRERIVAFRGPGDIIGERAALLLRRRSATIVAMDTVHGLQMTTQQFVAYLSDHPRVVAVMEREMYDRLTEEPSLALQAQLHDPAAQSRYESYGPIVRYEPYGPAAQYEPPAQYATVPTPLTHPSQNPQSGYVPYAAAVGLARSGGASWHGRPRTGGRVPAQAQATQPMAVNPPGPAVPSWAGQNCTIVFTDIAGFSASHRNDADRLGVRRAMYGLLREAFEESGVPWDACHIEDRGDGALIVIPPEVPTAAVIDPMIDSLAVRLRHHNQRSHGAVRIQLRVAVDVGPVMPDPPGVTGWALIRTARLLDARPLKDRLAATGADLGFIASPFVYESVIAHSPGYVNPAEYEPISCMVKKLKTEGWIHLRGVSAQSAV